MKSLLLSLFLLISPQLMGDEISWISTPRKIAIFPLSTSENLEAGLKANFWWEFRKAMSSDGRFLVSSKQFLQMKDSYQPREELNVKEVILLSEHLNADILMSLSLESNEIKLFSYSGEDGYPLKSIRIKFSGKLPKQEQLVSMANDLASQFLQNLPFLGTALPTTDESIYSFYVPKDLKSSDFEDVKLVKIKRNNTGELYDNNFQRITLGNLIFLKTEKGVASFSGPSGLAHSFKQNFLYVPGMDPKRGAFTKELPIKNIDQSEKQAESTDKIISLLGIVAILLISL